VKGHEAQKGAEFQEIGAKAFGQGKGRKREWGHQKKWCRTKRDGGRHRLLYGPKTGAENKKGGQSHLG